MWLWNKQTTTMRDGNDADYYHNDYDYTFDTITFPWEAVNWENFFVSKEISIPFFSHYSIPFQFFDFDHLEQLQVNSLLHLRHKKQKSLKILIDVHRELALYLQKLNLNDWSCNIEFSLQLTRNKDESFYHLVLLLVPSPIKLSFHHHHHHHLNRFSQ